MNITLKNFIFSVGIACWIIFAIFNVAYNSVKSVSEIREWVPLSDHQKREKIFGDSYDFSVFLNAHTKSNSKILFYSETTMPYFYARYFLYPSKLYWYQSNDPYIISTRPKRYDYIALYNMRASLQGFTLQASYSAKQTGVFGSLYKRK